jgi:hypothetical protein
MSDLRARAPLAERARIGACLCGSETCFGPIRSRIRPQCRACSTVRSSGMWFAEPHRAQTIRNGLVRRGTSCPLLCMALRLAARVFRGILPSRQGQWIWSPLPDARVRLVLVFNLRLTLTPGACPPLCRRSTILNTFASDARDGSSNKSKENRLGSPMRRHVSAATCGRLLETARKAKSGSLELLGAAAFYLRLCSFLSAFAVEAALQDRSSLRAIVGEHYDKGCCIHKFYDIYT